MTDPMPDAVHPPFYRRDGEIFVATEQTRGPWSKDHQHAGPPSALLCRGAEGLLPDMEVARLSCEMLKPVPIGPLRIEAQVEKAGRKAAVVRARLIASAPTGDVVCLDARVGCVRVAAVDAPALVHAPPPPGPETCPPFTFSFFPWETGYHTALEGRLARGTFGVGSMALWLRPRGALVEGEAMSPAQRALVVADAGSGVSLGLDVRRYSFANADLSVHLSRAPHGEWILLDASTWTSGNGRGVADTALSDVQGFIGRGVQTLIVERLG
jgi:Thioesterase-like superfamily